MKREVNVKDYTPANIRNLALIGHATVGKTTLAEAILFTAGEVNRLGTTDDGSTTSDYHSDEIQRKVSINASILHCEWRDCKINLIDAPGYSDFIGEVYGALRVADTAALVLNATSGVEVGTEGVWKIAESHQLPCMFLVNRMDKEHADFNKALAAAKDRFGNHVVAIQLPVNQGVGFNSFVDLVKMQLVTYETNGSGKVTTAAIPDNLKAEAEQLHEALVEAAAESDDSLMEVFFEKGTLSVDELRNGLRKGIINREIFPVFCTAASSNVGLRHFLDFVVDFGTAPSDRPAEKATKGSEQVERACDPAAPLSLLVFKTISEAHVGELSFFKVVSGKLQGGVDVQNTSHGVSEKIGQLYVMNGKERKEIGTAVAGDIAATVKLKGTHTGNTLADKRAPVVLKGIDFPTPVIRIAVEPKAKGDEDKISTGLHMLHEQDPTFVVQYDPELKQTIISGQGEIHLDIVVKRLKDKFGVDVDLVQPKIPYRETIKATAEVQYKHKKQSGGRGQYGDVSLRLEPLPAGSGFEFVDEIVGGVIPGKYIPAVEKGVREAMEEGVIAGFTVQDVRVAVFYGSYHNVDSSEMAFKIAASMAFKKGFREAKPVLLEPIYDVEVVVPEDYMGDVMGDLSSKRGKISGVETEGSFQLVKAKVPLAELYRYSTTLRSLTHGRGIHRRKFSHYEEVPGDVTQKIVAAKQAEES
jgi:elongation factor G